ncbi:MAG TPA: CFI-box-CTERM domain-containing protein [Nitrococcus sp.]|nr:CFI-box-CTERM domain-containing protein [Nitrococcus sp.]
MNDRDNGQRRLSATELAELARCERQAMYRHHGYVGRVDPALAAARRRGEAEHECRHRENLSHRPTSTPGDRRPCFIATAVCGSSAWQTERLRDWRDRALLPSRTGRALVTIYYQLSPPVAVVLGRWPLATRLIRAVLDLLARRLAG